MAATSEAAVLFDSGPPNGWGFYSDPGAGQIMGVAFTLAAPATVRHVTWRGGPEGAGTDNGTDNFAIAFYNFGGAAPDTAPAVSYSVLPSRSSDGTFFGSLQQYRYVASIPDTVLMAGTYFVSITNDLNDPDDDWAWSRTDTDAPLFKKNAPSDPWTQLTFPDNRLVVILADEAPGGGNTGGGNGGAVPEPETCALFTLGLGAFLALRRNRQAL
jgi:hypothetical protein